ncbi:MAG: sugar transferase [bacterium]|nr:sugar transferase [bacterium]MBU1916975.1 sugar transferase [bacterium]
MVKRIFDLVLSSFGLIIMSPFILLFALAIKIDSKGPVFYRGVRVGRGGKSFRIYKFRSMVADAEKSGVSSTSGQDMRVTRMGNLIRKFKMDEISQLINVFLGDMSLVGPRPEVQKFVDLYNEEEKQILNARPGITDWSSIKFHNEGEIIEQSGIADADEAYAKLIRPEKLRLQLKYIRERNLWIDIKIIVATIATIIVTRAGGKPIGVPKV